MSVPAAVGFLGDENGASSDEPHGKSVYQGSGNEQQALASYLCLQVNVIFTIHYITVFLYI